MLITTSRAAALVEKSESIIRIWADRGVLPCTRTSSGQRLFKLTDVQRIAAERQKKAGGK